VLASEQTFATEKIAAHRKSPFCESHSETNFLIVGLFALTIAGYGKAQQCRSQQCQSHPKPMGAPHSQ